MQLIRFVISLSFLISLSSAFSSDSLDLPVSNISIAAPNIDQRIDETIKNPEAILKRYQPVGISISGKKISGNQVQFMATKSVLGISRTVFYQGTLDITEVNAPNKSRCFNAVLDFMGSGDLIYRNVEKLNLFLCVHEVTLDHLEGTVKPTLFKGSEYGGVLGTIAKNLVVDQIDPMIAVVKAEIINSTLYEFQFN